MDTQRIRDAVKAAISANPRHLKGEAIALRMGISPSALYSWGEANGKQIPLDRLIQLVLVTGDFRPVIALAEVCGGTFIPRGAEGGGDCREESIKIVQAFAVLLKDSSDAILDNATSHDELRRIQNDGARAMLATAQLIGAFERDESAGAGHAKTQRHES